MEKKDLQKNHTIEIGNKTFPTGMLEVVEETESDVVLRSLDKCLKVDKSLFVECSAPIKYIKERLFPVFRDN